MKIEIKYFVKGGLQNNTYIVYDTESKIAALIDLAKFKEGGEVDEFIEGKNLNIKYLILTHGHGDHIGGVNDFLKKYKETKVIACEEEREILGVPKNNYTEEILKNGISITPDIFVNDGEEIILKDEFKFTVIHTPGHTPGGICLYLKENKKIGVDRPVLFSGDTLFYNSCGRADLFGGDWNTLVKSIREKLYVLPKETIVYSGHGPSTDIGNEINNNPYVGLDFDYSGE